MDSRHVKFPIARKGEVANLTAKKVTIYELPPEQIVATPQFQFRA